MSQCKGWFYGPPLIHTLHYIHTYKIPCCHLCSRLSEPQAYSVAGNITSTEKSNGLIGNRTRGLPACSIVHQPPRVPKELRKTIRDVSQNSRCPCLYPNRGPPVYKSRAVPLSQPARIEYVANRFNNAVWFHAVYRLMICSVNARLHQKTINQGGPWDRTGCNLEAHYSPRHYYVGH
jgi:hypothetical protein